MFEARGATPHSSGSGSLCELSWAHRFASLDPQLTLRSLWPSLLSRHIYDQYSDKIRTLLFRALSAACTAPNRIVSAVSPRTVQMPGVGRTHEPLCFLCLRSRPEAPEHHAWKINHGRCL